MEQSISSYKHSNSQGGLLMIAGIVWLSAGLLLNQRGIIYILEFSRHILFHSSVGFAGSVLIFLVLTHYIVNRYAKHLAGLKTTKNAVFNFQFLVGNILMGILVFLLLCLRHYGFGDRLLLSIVYIAIGFSLIFGALYLFYYITRLKHTGKNKTENSSF